jgi:hypothetical protein
MPTGDRPDERSASDSRKPAEGLSRRLTLAGIAVVGIPTTALAAAAEPDPVFALIAAKRAADVVHLDSRHVLNEAERRYGVGSEEANDAFERGGPACHAAFDAAYSLASTPPTTLVGVLAVLRFVSEIEDQGQWPEDTGLERKLLATTAQATQTIIRQGVV